MKYFSYDRVNFSEFPQFIIQLIDLSSNITCFIKEFESRYFDFINNHSKFIFLELYKSAMASEDQSDSGGTERWNGEDLLRPGSQRARRTAVRV